MYIAELAPPHLRGTLVTLNQVCICTGVLFGYAVDKALTPHWRWELASGAPLAVAVLLAFIFVTPYSPRWLMARGRDEEARAVLLRLRGGRTREVAAEMALIADAIARTAGAALGSYVLISANGVALYLALFTGVIIYIATSHILPEAHANHPSRWTLVASVVGIAAMWMIKAHGA
jgi:hypothetical protein